MRKKLVGNLSRIWGTSLGALAFIFLMCVPTFADSVTVSVTVPGSSDPWLALMPIGSLSNLNTDEDPDVSPAQSPVFVSTVVPGSLWTWSASGRVGSPGIPAGPNGYAGNESNSYEGMTNHLVGAGAQIVGAGAENGISDINAPINSLLGVFLGWWQPDLFPAPGYLDFTLPGSRNYDVLYPALQQVFYMGSGSTGQTVMAPLNATYLFLGTMDGYGWANNNGSFAVTLTAAPVPEASTMLLLGSGLIGLWGFRKRVRKS